jgi:hypothetical protein
LGYGIDGTLPNVGGVKGGLVYDLYDAKFSNVYASIDGYVTKKLTVSADWDYYVPTFDGDSIWNFFQSMPTNDFGLRAAVDATDHFAISGGGRVRLFSLQTGPNNDPAFPTAPNGIPAGNYYPSSGSEVMGGGNLAARYHFGEGSLGARGSADFATNGERVGMDVYGERTLETRIVLSARTGVWQWDDKLRPDRDATSFQYVLGAGYKLLSRSLVFADFEHDMNRLAGQRFRAMLWLSLAVSK